MLDSRVPLERLHDGPFTRHKAAAEAWAVAHGHVNAWGYPMLSALRDQGISLRAGAAGMERLIAVGVRAEAEDETHAPRKKPKR